MNTLSTPNSPASEPLPMAWIERLFQRMHGQYGNVWLDKWRVGEAGANGQDLGVENAKRTWAEDLADMQGTEIAVGIATCKNLKFPPSLPEFRNLCRQEDDIEALFHKAVGEMGKRRKRQQESWPSNRLFWAAQRIGNDLLIYPYRDLAGRWKFAWNESVVDQGKAIPVVAPNVNLLENSSTFNRAEASKRVGELNIKTAQGGPRKWAYDIAKEPKGKSLMQIQMACNALIAFGEDLGQWPELVERMPTRREAA
ncbi:hypothetical protein [Silvimonas soli]|uniref:hypothetical protein n=1 Tax=Silvimonas soli TaxID=2980100 RepID=UPI0024B38C5B|nr:hypothetical protein [Silvimonas soli]